MARASDTDAAADFPVRHSLKNPTMMSAVTADSTGQSEAIIVGAPATQWWIQLSTAIVFGLGFATVLTLIVTPAALMLIEQMRQKRIRTLAALAARFHRKLVARAT